MHYVIHARIRRDAHTITPVTVRPHEVAILQTIHGEENIQDLTGQVLNLKALEAADVAGQIPPSEDEFNRLSAKYGGDEGGLIVEQVYGKRATGGLEAAAERLDAAVAKVAPAEGEAVAAATGRGRGRGKAPAEGEGSASQPQE